MPTPRNPIPLEKKSRRALLTESVIAIAWCVGLAILVLSFLWGRFSGSGAWFMLGISALCEMVVLRQMWLLVREIHVADADLSWEL